MAEYLVQSPYFYLTSIPGVAVILAAYIAGEIGEPSKWKFADSKEKIQKNIFALYYIV